MQIKVPVAVRPSSKVHLIFRPSSFLRESVTADVSVLVVIVFCGVVRNGLGGWELRSTLLWRRRWIRTGHGGKRRVVCCVFVIGDFRVGRGTIESTIGSCLGTSFFSSRI